MNAPSPLDPSLPEPLARREFLRMLAAAGAATLSMGAPRLLAEGEKVVQPAATADACILIWLAGGMAAPRPSIRNDTRLTRKASPMTACSALSRRSRLRSTAFASARDSRTSRRSWTVRR
jgi:hypothetical protein